MRGDSDRAAERRGLSCGPRGVAGLRLASAGIVLLALGGARWAIPDPAERATALYLFVVTLGYGHLLGGAVFGWERLASRVPGLLRSGRGQAFALSTLALLLVAWLWALGVWPTLMAPLLVVSVWHAVENDLAWERDGRGVVGIGTLAPGAVSSGVTAWVCALFAASLPSETVSPSAAWSSLESLSEPLGWAARSLALGCGLWLLRSGSGRAGTALVLGTVALPGDLTRWLGFVEVFGAWTLHHLVSWLLVSVWRVRRSRNRGEARRETARLVGVHLLPVLVAALVLAAPVGWDHPLRALLFAPGVYLFWAVLHVVQTALLRASCRPPCCADPAR